MYLFKHGSFYHLQYKDLKGKWKRITTKKKTEDEAENFKQQFILKQQINNPSLTPKQVNQPCTNEYNYASLKLKILRNAEINLCQNSANIQIKVLNEFEKIAGNKLLSEITAFDVEEYKQYRSSHIEKATVNRDIVTLRTIFNLATKWKLMVDNPAKDVKKYRVEQNEIVCFEPYEIEKLTETLLKEPEFAYFNNIFIFALNTGMRLNEIVQMQWNNIDFKERKIVIRNKANFKTKTGKIRNIPINNTLLELLQRIKPNNVSPDYYLFGKGQFSYTKHYISRKFSQFVKRANINPNLHFHSCRHTFITNLVKNNVALTKVQKLAGHSNIQTTLIYTHLHIDDLRDAVETLNL